jgi:lipoyl synthase
MQKLKINLKELHDLKVFLRKENLNTVCESARCPNINTCFNSKKATFMLLGNLCTRSCLFCNIDSNLLRSDNNNNNSLENSKSLKLDLSEPERILNASKNLNLKHIVLTSVTRDDLKDGGASIFAKTINLLKKENFTVEVLTPDFKGDLDSLNIILKEGPDVFNHNIETTKDLSSFIRPQADYSRSLAVLNYAKNYSRKNSKTIYIKSGFMLGLGECKEDVYKTINDLNFIDVLTIGQYFKPNKNCIDVKKYYTDDDFENYKKYALDIGINYVFAGTYVRSSYMAEKLLNIIINNKKI